MENIVMITLLTLTLFGKIEMHTFEIPNTREDYNGRDGINWHDSNALVCSSWYHQNVDCIGLSPHQAFHTHL